MTHALEEDPVHRFRQFELEGWEQSVDAYDNGFSQITGVVGERMLKALEVMASMTLLDVACGPGHLCDLARRLGARVVGVDFSKAMLAKARSKYPDVEFVSGDAEALGFEDESFDAVTMNFGIPHLGKPTEAVQEMARVVRERGRIAFSAWAPPEEALGFKVVLDAVAEFGDKDVSLPAGPSFFKYSSADVAEADASSAGLRHFRVEVVPLVWRFNQIGDFFETFHRGTARTGGLLRAQSRSTLGRIKDRVEETLTRCFRVGESMIEVPMTAKIYSARK